MMPKSRVARYTRIAAKRTANVTDEQLIVAPSAGQHIVIDALYFNISVAGSIEFKSATGAWADSTGILGGNFGANGGFVTLTNLEMPDASPLVWTSSGTAPIFYVSISYHLEGAP